MPYEPDITTQPEANPFKGTRRIYIPAEWAALGAGGGHPKLSGGYTVDLETGLYAPRGFNRPSQTYDITQIDLLARRSATATAEYPSSVVLQGPNGGYEIRSQSGNNYDLNATVTFCDCPDWRRVDNSGYGIVRCKHIYLVFLGLADPSYPFGLDWSCRKVAQATGYSVRAIEHACSEGWLPATKRHNVWSIPAAEAEPFVPLWIGRIWPYS